MTNVGYYDISSGMSGSNSYADPITAVGQTAVPLSSLTASDLAGIDTLFLLNPSNDDYGSEFLQSRNAIEAFVRAGGHLVIFDRFVASAGSILPGEHGLHFTRSLGADVDFVDDDGIYAVGPGGTLTDQSLDGGTASDHGYIDGDQLGSRFTVIQTTGDPDQVVSFSYELGTGSVFYSSIPLDYYLVDGGLPGSVDFAENVLNAVVRVAQSGSDGADFIHVAGDGHVPLGGVTELTLATPGADDIDAGKGNDIVFGGGGGDRLKGGLGGDTIHGEGGNDAILGGGGNDRLSGGHGHDVLFGGDGRDVLFGGRDQLYGGADADIFLFTAAHGGTIRDFSSAEGDRIDLHRIDADQTTAGNQAFSFIGSDAFSGTAGELRYDGAVVQADTNGDGHADLTIAVTGVSALAGTDFIL